ncbi:ExbD/TolR family protein [Thermodesulfobacteriota bacterium]
MQAKSDDGIFAEINLIPFIDVCLVLLLIFMITATMIVAGTGIDIKLPKAATAKTQEQLEVVVCITEEKKIYVGAKEVDVKSLYGEIEEKLRETENMVVIISADRTIPYDKLIEVLDTVRLAGVENIALAAELKKDDETSPLSAAVEIVEEQP